MTRKIIVTIAFIAASFSASMASEKNAPAENAGNMVEVAAANNLKISLYNLSNYTIPTRFLVKIKSKTSSFYIQEYVDVDPKTWWNGSYEVPTREDLVVQIYGDTIWEQTINVWWSGTIHLIYYDNRWDGMGYQPD